MTFEVMKLNKAVEKYPQLRKFNLQDGEADQTACGSSMKIALRYRKLRYITAVIVLKDDEPIGWAWIIHKRAYYWSTIKTKRYLLAWFYIAGAERRKGIGSKLATKVKEIARKRHRPLDVEPWDKKSCEFFAKNGMKD